MASKTDRQESTGKTHTFKFTDDEYNKIMYLFDDIELLYRYNMINTDNFSHKIFMQVKELLNTQNRTENSYGVFTSDSAHRSWL